MLSERTVQRLHDMIEDADRIAVFIDGMSLYEFLADERTIFAVERLLQRITEAAIQIGIDEASQVAGLPIVQMRALGNRLRHEYRDIDRGVIFDIARSKVPEVRAAAELALED
jgi:uncharacterized protein with HEPN domain